MGKLLRSVALSLSFAFGVIGMSVGINALVKSNNSKDSVKARAPQGVTVDIDTSDAFDSGAVLTVGCGLLAFASLFSALLALFRPRAHKPHLGALVHFSWVTWIFASLVAFDVIARNRSAEVTAFLGGQQLPDSFVQQQEQTLGVSPRYWDHDYIKIFAILPWFTFLFGTIAGIVLLLSPSERQRVLSAAAETSERGALRGEGEIEKRSTEKRDSSDSPISPVSQTGPAV